MYYIQCIRTVVIPRPKIIIGLKDALVRRNTSVQLECHFRTLTTKQFVNFIWLKDDKPIDLHSSKYHFSLGTVPGTYLRMMTKLRIFEFTDEDKGKYSCYSKYNQVLVMRQIGVKSEIISDVSSANIRLTGIYVLQPSLCKPNSSSFTTCNFSSNWPTA